MFESYKKITLNDMMKYIQENAPADKDWFKKVALDEEGNYQHLIAVREFCGRYMPELLPVAKPKPISGKQKLKDW